MKFPEKIPEIVCSRQLLQQVIINLLFNARDALNQKYHEHSENKVINVSVETLVKEGVSLIRIIVEDSGCGIPDDIRDRLFDPFFSTKPVHKGTGLGLSISYGIIQDHEGDLSFSSREGEGSKFIIDLPWSP